MQMTDEEIRASMANAVNPKKQVQVLADLNGVPRKNMIEKLDELGCGVPESTNRLPKKWVPKLDEVRARELISEGKTDLEAAEMLGVPESTFRVWRINAGLPPNRKQRKTRAKNQDPVPEPDVPASHEPGTMIVARLEKILSDVGKWYADAPVLASGKPIRRVELVRVYDEAGEQTVEVRLE